MLVISCTNLLITRSVVFQIAKRYVLNIINYLWVKKSAKQWEKRQSKREKSKPSVIVTATIEEYWDDYFKNRPLYI